MNSQSQNTARLIVNHELCKVFRKDGLTHVLVRLSEGGWLRMNPLSGDLKGEVGALILATDVISGKFWPAGAANVEDAQIQQWVLEAGERRALSHEEGS